MVTQLGLSPGGTVVKCHVLVMVIREMGCSVRGTDLATGSLARRWVFFLGGDVPGKLICTEAGAYELHLKKVELVLVPVCSGSYQSLRIAPRVYSG